MTESHCRAWWLAALLVPSPAVVAVVVVGAPPDLGLAGPGLAGPGLADLAGLLLRPEDRQELAGRPVSK